MSFNIIEASNDIANKYRRYLNTMFDISDVDYKRIFEKELQDNRAFEKGPFLDVTNSFYKGRSVKQLIKDSVLSADFKYITRLYNIPQLHYHQEEALIKAISGENLIVSTGTGSGKTECFLIPVINELMREKEAGTLDDGVRALIIYPMNALANDQIDRLRKLFIDYPFITFGCYTGQTMYHEESHGNNKGALEQYEELNGKRTDDRRLRTPLKNERLSRDSMKDKPPHILITNYAMLEYLMLRPEDNVFFNGEKSKFWKYIILDEAHTYVGATGIEVSMLLRRLVAELGNNTNIQYILTSATLGDEHTNKDVIQFANQLCSAEFKAENIIRAKRVDIQQSTIRYTLNPNFYKEINALLSSGYEDSYIINIIENKYHFEICESNISEYLYELLIYDNSFWNFKNYLKSTKSIKEIKNFTGWTDEQISDFVEVASKAYKNQSKLFDSRYHMFIRATEGVFITLAPHKDLFLTRKNYIEDENGEQYKVFEAVTCTHCHSLYLIGTIENNCLIQKASIKTDELREAFFLGEQVNDSDEDVTLKDSELSVEEFELCPHCGFIRSVQQVHKQSCGHNENHFVKVIKVHTTNIKTGRVTKCISCENFNRLGILRGFFSGQEASTAVVGTSLFEALPEHVKIITRHQQIDDDGFDIEINDSEEEFEKAKQFIAFSDNRQAAAYFASYFSISYDGFLYGKLIRDVIISSFEPTITLNKFISELSYQIEKNKIIPLDNYLTSLKNTTVHDFEYEKIAWQAILKELIDNNSKNSLYGLGLLSLDFSSELKFGSHKKYNLTIDEVKSICMVFVLGMFSDAAIYYEQGMNDIDRSYFTHNGIELTYLKDSGGKYIRSFVPQQDTKSNKRFDYLFRVLKKIDPRISREEVKKVLVQIWNSFFAPNSDKPQIMNRDKDAHYKVNIHNFVLVKNPQLYRCNKCQKITSHNVHNVCPSYHCDGILEKIDINTLYKDNHYYRMYHDLQIRPLRIVEHTAQLNREEAYNYQNLFKEQKIDVLSCSTTFEMGVDVGDLETVFMRNMPPSASNYAQRAGRAGRSSTSAAFALTFCNRTNHDFNYFERPTDMINGTILPPIFKTDNAKICIRHLYSSALAYFFRKFPKYFSNVRSMMESSEKTPCGYDLFKAFLTTDSNERNELKIFLLHSIPQELKDKFMINTFGWVDWLFNDKPNEFPSLTIVRNLYIMELQILRKELEIAKQNDKVIEQSRLLYRIKNYEEEKIINFLSKHNILPKYGFPVDTVELDINIKNEKELSGLDLSRDLSIAIAEYAPGCQIIANNRLITSRYIKKATGIDWKKYDYINCNNCNNLNVMVHVSQLNGKQHPLSICKQCSCQLEEKNIKTFLIPEFGFITDEKISKPSLVKPERTFRTEASFFINKDSKEDSNYKIGNSLISIAMVGNDGEMAMLNTSDFYVCPICGYAIESTANLNPYVKTYMDRNYHHDSRGYSCKNRELEKYSLGYKFMTDVIRIRIHKPLLSERPHDEAYSILQALILTTCKELNIEHTEISGCLQYYWEDTMNYSYILYDNTPGGAGHVKRLNNPDVIHNILINAMNFTLNCKNCSNDSSCYSCLRTYHNQKNHDIIKRSYVYEYIGEILK